MIKLYITSRKLSNEDKDICVRLTLPADKKNIWLAMQKAEIENIDDCELIDVECGIAEAQEFLQSVDIASTNVFKLNYFARLLSIMDSFETEIFKEHIMSNGFQNVEQASVWIRDTVLE